MTSVPHWPPGILSFWVFLFLNVATFYLKMPTLKNALLFNRQNRLCHLERPRPRPPSRPQQDVSQGRQRGSPQGQDRTCQGSRAGQGSQPWVAEGVAELAQGQHLPADQAGRIGGQRNSRTLTRTRRRLPNILDFSDFKFLFYNVIQFSVLNFDRWGLK